MAHVAPLFPPPMATVNSCNFRVNWSTYNYNNSYTHMGHPIRVCMGCPIRAYRTVPYTYVTGYWKTDYNVTLGQLHFIGPANSHTRALSMHWCITGLSWLVCFSRAGFADRVKSRLRQWDPWRALNGRCESDIHPCVGETSLKALQSCLGLWLALLGLMATPNSPVGRCNAPPASPPTRPPSYTCNPWYYNCCEKFAKNSAVLASYYR